MFEDRSDAGRKLAARLSAHPAVKDEKNLFVLSIPRGGVVVGHAIAQALKYQHDVVIVKKIGFPGCEESAIGAVAEDGHVLLNHEAVAWYGLSKYTLDPVIAEARAKVAYYVKLFRQNQPLALTGKAVILVDDGIATGETMKAAIRWAESRHVTTKLIVATPVCSPRTAATLRNVADEVICLIAPNSFVAVGQFYRHFEPVADDDVLEILRSDTGRTFA